MTLRILVRGGGDLASGAVLRLWRAGWDVLITELIQPRTVRRLVSFSQAVYDGESRVEEAVAIRVDGFEQAQAVLAQRGIPILVDEQAAVRVNFHPHVLIDGRMRKRPSELPIDSAALMIGLGPGFSAGHDCHAVVETKRGPFLGRVMWQGTAEADTGIPEQVSGFQGERVLRAPAAGKLEPQASIGDHLHLGDPVARVAGIPITAPFAGVLRGLVQAGLTVAVDEKVGDLDPRDDARLCYLVSDKALAVGGGVLEAVLSFPALRPFWQTNLKT
jgi:xanthine dehydrogenase accessory factor